MTDPRIEGSLADLSFRGPARSTRMRSEAPEYFWIGVAIFFGVALAYPFYSYQVQKYLLQRDVSSAVSELTDGMNEVANEALRQSDRAASRAAASAATNRQQAVAVLGTTMVGGKRIVIVRLGNASLAESQANICQQASVRFGQSLGGERLRVQRHRGSQPAVEAGTIVCD